MGLGIVDVKMYLELWQQGYFKNLNSVIDMGSQELHLRREDFERLIQSVGAFNYKPENFVNLNNFPLKQPRCSTKPFYEMLGAKKYSCIDMNAEHGAIPLDLNFPLKDTPLYGQYDLVTDHGCNEHVFNIAEAYRTMHRLCRPQGIMVICQSVWKGNGYYLFDLSFFEGLAAANNYSILYSAYSLSFDIHTQIHIPLSRELLYAIDWTRVSDIGICYVFQKQLDSDFQYAYQGKYLSQVQRNEGYKIKILPNPPSRSYVPLSESALEVTQTKVLIKYVISRIIRRFKRSLIKK